MRFIAKYGRTSRCRAFLLDLRRVLLGLVLSSVSEALRCYCRARPLLRREVEDGDSAALFQ